MKGLHSLKGEFRNIFTNKTLLVAVLAVLFIPVLYSGTFLWAFWDPYGQVDQLPVAVVNKDKGADFNGEELTIGNDFVEELGSRLKRFRESKSFSQEDVARKIGVTSCYIHRVSVFRSYAPTDCGYFGNRQSFVHLDQVDLPYT